MWINVFFEIYITLIEIVLRKINYYPLSNVTHLRDRRFSHIFNI